MTKKSIMLETGEQKYKIGTNGSWRKAGYTKTNWATSSPPVFEISTYECELL